MAHLLLSGLASHSTPLAQLPSEAVANPWDPDGSGL